MIIMILVLNTIAFVNIHNQTRFIDKYPNGWRQIVNYCLGVVGTLPFFLLLHNELKNNKHCGILAYLIAFLGSGIGTSVGWMYRDLKERK